MVRLTPKLSPAARFAYANLVTSAGVPCWVAFMGISGI